MDDLDKRIFERFQVKPDDTLPFRGWAGNRHVLAEVMGEVGFKAGAEIGVCQGIYSEILCEAMPGLRLICVDPWQPYPVINRKAMIDRRYQDAIEKLTKYGVEFKRMTSMEAVDSVPDGSLDFVYIDALHTFDAVIMDIVKWRAKVRIGGIMAGHDYNHFYKAGVIQAVDAYTHAHGINPWYITRDREPSWFWVVK